MWYNIRVIQAGVAKLADALVSGTSGRNTLWVQVPSPAPEKTPRIPAWRFFKKTEGNS